MSTGRVQSFSDGVVAILITIMVLQLQVPHEPTLKALHPLIPLFLTYVLSFINIGIYWSNHHHLLASAKRVNGKILWANLHLLFWLSLFTFFTGWMGENSFAKTPVAAYGVVLLGAGFAYTILQRLIVAEQGNESRLAQALGTDVKGKISVALYVFAIPLALLNRWIAVALYVVVSLMWLIPDRRIENELYAD